MNLYAHEKIRQLESELKDALYFEPGRPRRRAIVGGLAAGAGSVLRRTGERLEAWSTHPHAEQGKRFSRASFR
jgi:hypothetical protein